jgi:uncharacterized protein DUF5672
MANQERDRRDWLMLYLPDVTLVCLAGNHIRATEAALSDVFAAFAFEEVMIFADEPILWHDTIVTPMRSVEAATEIAWRGVLPRLKTTHVLSMHWDGYPVHPDQWSDDFRKFDYIGAVWPWFTERSVGNSGFSLQSRRFLEAITNLPMKQPEDISLCRDYRWKLESRGIQWAPEDVADRFSTEHGPGRVPLGFHGVWNMLYVMDDETLKQRLMLMTKDAWGRQQIDTLGMRAMVAGRRELYRWINRTRAEVMRA